MLERPQRPAPPDPPKEKEQGRLLANHFSGFDGVVLLEDTASPQDTAEIPGDAQQLPPTTLLIRGNYCKTLPLDKGLMSLRTFPWGHSSHKIKTGKIRFSFFFFFTK